MITDKPIWIDDNGKAVDAITNGGGTLLAGAGGEVSDGDVERYGLDKPKAKAPAEDKAVKPAEDKENAGADKQG